ncbi:hypothetical protein [Rheinheimera sp.]|uniref:hypothetical protein n=1 Tax=Rheinheimera sp. TaxID=1869214 RepID=UPI0040481060
MKPLKPEHLLTLPASATLFGVAWLALLAAYNGLARLAALANLNNGKLLLIKNYTG